MAALVFNHENTVCGSITIAGPIQRFTKDRRQEMLDSLLDSAANFPCCSGMRANSDLVFIHTADSSHQSKQALDGKMIEIDTAACCLKS